MTNIIHDTWVSKVRNYEVDYQGVVNNAVYFNYLDNARAILLDKIGLNVNELATKNINIVMIKTEIFFKKSLKSGDNFHVKTTFSRIGKFKFNFSQKIYLKDNDERIYTTAESIAASVDASGKPVFIEEIS